MKHAHFIFAFGLVLSGGILCGQPVTVKNATKIAGNQLFIIDSLNRKDILISTRSTFRDLSLVEVATDSLITDTLYFVFNISGNGGFIIVAADKNVYPVLGYSNEGNYSKSEQPPEFVRWMASRKKEIAFIKSKKNQKTSSLTAAWDNLTESNPVIDMESVNPLIQTTWGQGCYYNSLCPEDPDGPCDRCVTGCVATATAQIMKYWNYPVSGNGTLTYYDITYGKISANFGATSYQWSQMPKKLTSSNDALATLIYHCGVSVKMNYGPDGSTASDPRSELINYFRYSSSAKLVKKNNYSNSDWENLLKDELNSLHPIYYSGDGTGGHAFVCDGYQNTNFFHFNWGWGGKYDGYFYLGNLNPGDHDYTNTQEAVIHIFPNSVPSAAKTISGPSTVCQGQASVTYSVPLISGASSYIWMLPAGSVGTSTSNSITVNFSTSAQSSSIKVRGHNDLGDGEESSLNIKVNALPSPPGQITGNSDVCFGDIKTYSVNNVAGVTYEWSFPKGWTQTSGGTTNSVTVKAGSSKGNIQVTPSNDCGKGIAALLAVTASSAMPAKPDNIKGETSVCFNDLETYSVNNVTGVTYDWSFPEGWINIAGGTTNSVTVKTGQGSGFILVTPLNGCGKGKPAALAVVANHPPLQPDPMVGAPVVCMGDSKTYSVSHVEGIAYNWSIPRGWTQTAGGTTNSVTVTAGSGGGTITVTPLNQCGKGTARTLVVNSLSKPSQPEQITGAVRVGLWEMQSYSVTYIEGVSYNWGFPTGWLQAEGGTSNLVMVKVGSSTGNITVTPFNFCGVGTPSSIYISEIMINFSGLFKNIILYPNPVKSDLHIEMKDYYSPCKIQIINQSGQTVFSSEIVNKSVIHMMDLPGGVYTVKFEIENQFLIKKFVKSN